MFLMGERLKKAWADFFGTEPVTAAEVIDEPEFLAFLGSDCKLYPVSAETSDVLMPLMSTMITGGRMEYNGTEYGEEGPICCVELLHMPGGRYFRFPSDVEMVCGLHRLKKWIDVIDRTEQKRTAGKEFKEIDLLQEDSRGRSTRTD